MKNPAADKRLPDDFRDLPDRAAGKRLVCELDVKENRLIFRAFSRVPRCLFLLEIIRNTRLRNRTVSTAPITPSGYAQA